MSLINSDNKLNVKRAVYAALTKFGLTFTVKKMTITSDLPTIDPTTVQAMLYSSNVTGVNGIYTSASETAPIVGTTYVFSIMATIPGRALPPFRIEATATSTSFTDLADAFVAQINGLALNGLSPLPASAVNTAGHVVITEVPPTGYGAGECKLDIQPITQINGTAEATWTTSTANVKPVGAYATVQRAYVAVTQSGQTSTIPQWDGFLGGGAPVSTTSYDVITILSAPIDRPNTDANSYNEWILYLDTALSATQVTGTYTSGTIVGTTAQVINAYARSAGL